MPKNHGMLIREVLVALRGPRSQETLNRKLKTKSNQVARWESGHASIDWSSFREVCKATKAPLAAALKKHLFYEGDLEDVQRLMDFFSGFSPQKKLAAKLGLSVSQISRISSGKSPMSVDFFFRLVELSPYSLTDFIAALTQPNLPPLIVQEMQRTEKEKNFHYSHPWVAALLLHLRTKEYTSLKNHSHLFLAQKLGQSEQDIALALKTLEDLQIVEKKNGLYVSELRHLSTGGSFEGALSIRKYWLKKFLSWLDGAQPGQTHFYGYKVFNVHESHRAKFEDFYFRMNNELDALIKEQPSEASDKVYVFSFQMREAAETPG